MRIHTGNDPLTVTSTPCRQRSRVLSSSLAQNGRSTADTTNLDTHNTERHRKCDLYLTTRSAFDPKSRGTKTISQWGLSNADVTIRGSSEEVSKTLQPFPRKKEDGRRPHDLGKLQNTSKSTGTLSVLSYLHDRLKLRLKTHDGFNEFVNA